MNRLHAFEWEDQPWLPRVFRDCITDHLRFALEAEEAMEMHRAVAACLKAAMERLGTREIVDLCSGGGGPLLAVQRCLASEMAFPTKVTLTDLYPNLSAFKRIEAEGNGAVRCLSQSVSVFEVPEELRGIRTLFTALHHFRPADARRILEDAVNKRAGIAVFEPLERTPRIIFLTGLSVERFLLTYPVPLCPFVITWDGVVSALRTYSVDELRELTAGLGEGIFSWQIERSEWSTALGPFPFTSLIGVPETQ